jgi:DNA-binding transcriptional LysR family regulator
MYGIFEFFERNESMLAHLREHVEKLHAFSAVARAGSLSGAANTLKISQAGLSYSLKTLEGVLGASLFVRSARGMTLTQSGEVLFDYCKKLFLDLEAVEAAVRNPRAVVPGRLRIGTHETLAIHVWPAFLRRLAQKQPNLFISLISGRVHGLVQSLKNEEFDLIVTVEPAQDRALAVNYLYSGDFGFFAASRAAVLYPELAQAKLKRAEVDAVPLLTDASAEIRQFSLIPTFLGQHGFRLERFFELNSFEAAIQLAGHGLGLAFLPRRNAAAAVRSHLLRPLAVEGLPRKGFGAYRICATCLKSRVKDPIVISTLRELQQTF